MKKNIEMSYRYNFGHTHVNASIFKIENLSKYKAIRLVSKNKRSCILLTFMLARSQFASFIISIAEDA